MKDSTDSDVAEFMMYRAMNYSYAEIAERTDFSKSTVAERLREVEDRAKASGDPDAVFWETMLARVFDSRLRQSMSDILS